ncbi:hypothetical protein ACFL5Q_00045 [Planctomycetota bacterium]
MIYPKCDIVDAYRAARARLKLGPYERYLVEHIAARVECLLSKRDARERGGERRGDVPEAGERAAFSAVARARVRANAPPV